MTKNWKTTLAGIIGAVVAYTVTAVQSGNAWDWKAWALGIPTLVLGFLAKDSNVTGGTVQQ
ncbi:hypothetical protein F6V25_08005 [Oryzomonas japonica]|uniref:Uncharacterized protein n=1 Tax=Oryzomonas japonica TaxID=2603858 RepID=A0A7J4ZRD6_9BACT|nr:hypothetical protein [Oryzomonas japonica]KAB0665656.1 hypothetical protein F6V25_08005 [Oryzomonas japonica]